MELVPTRDGFGKGLVKAGERNRNVVALCADLTESTRVSWFKQKFPERFIECGVSEENMIGMAAGLSFAGKVPFAVSYAVFSPGNSWGPLRVSVCYSKANVKVVGAHAGLTTGADGATHQALEDIAITRCLPNMTVVVPCDALEAEKATLAIAEHEGPCYLRIGREKSPLITSEETPFTLGMAEVFKDGKDVAIIACGVMVSEALEAAQKLKRQGFDCAVINCHTIKPMDSGLIMRYARKCGAIVTAEEHQVMGGLGSAVAEVLARACPVPIRFVGVKDVFGESGSPRELMEKYTLTSTNIANAAKEALSAKGAEVCPEIHEYHPSQFPQIVPPEIARGEKLISVIPGLQASLSSLSKRELKELGLAIAKRAENDFEKYGRKKR